MPRENPPLSVSFGINSLIIGEKSYPIKMNTPLSEQAKKEIAEQIRGRKIVILCSVGTNTRCEGEYLKAVLSLFAPLYRAQIITDLEILACDGNQRHNYQFEHYLMIVN